MATLSRQTFNSKREFGEEIIRLDSFYEGKDPEAVADALLDLPEFESVRIVEGYSDIDPLTALSNVPGGFAETAGGVLTGIGQMVTSPIETGRGLLHTADEAISLAKARGLEAGFDIPRERAEEIAAPWGKEGIDPNVKNLLEQLAFGVSPAGVEENPPRALADALSVLPARAGLGALERAGRGGKMVRGARRGLEIADPTTALFAGPMEAFRAGRTLTQRGGRAAKETSTAAAFREIGSNLVSEDVPILREMVGSSLGFTTSLGSNYIQELIRRAGQRLRSGRNFDDIFESARGAPIEDTITEVAIRGNSAMDRINNNLQNTYQDATRRAFAAVEDTGIPTGSLFDDLQEAAAEFGVKARRTGFSDDVGELRQARLTPAGVGRLQDIHVRYRRAVSPPKFTVDQMVQELAPQLRRQQGVAGRQEVLDEVRRIATGAPSSPQNPTLRQAIEQLIASDLPAGAQGSLAEEAMRIIRQEIRPRGAARSLDIATEATPEIPPRIERAAARAQERRGERFGVDAGDSDIAEIGSNRRIVERALERFLNMPEARVGGDDLLSALRGVGRTEGLEPSVLNAVELHRLRKLLDDDISALSATSDVSRRTRSVLSDMRRVVADHLEGNLGKRYSDAMADYETGIALMDEADKTLGLRPGMISKNGQLNPEGFEQTIRNIASAFDESEDKARRLRALERVQTLAQDDHIAPMMMGVAARPLHGSGLVVRSEIAQLARGFAALALGTSGTFAGGPLAGASALALFSPRMMTELILQTKSFAPINKTKAAIIKISEEANALDRKTGGRLRKELQRAGWRMGELFERLNIELEEQGKERVTAPDDLLGSLSPVFSGAQ